MTSFDFTFVEGAQAKGKVFARRKQQPQANSPKKVVEISEKPSSQGIKKKKVVQTPEKRKLNPPETVPSQYIKRKQKKDKLIAKNSEVNVEQEQQQQSRVNVGGGVVNHSLFSVKHKNLYVNTNVPGKSVVEKVFSGEKFSDLGLHKYVVSNLEKNGFTTLTKVQEKAIPKVLEGKNVLIRSQTGSGKTLAYAVPIVEALHSITPRIQRQDGVQAVIVVPTRELALQTHELITKINTFQWIVVGHLCGGENRKTEKDRLRKGVHILIGTPGRLLDHILHTTALKIENCRCLVLDEADRLLDMGFKKDIVKIVEELDRAKVNSEYDPVAMLKGQKKDGDVEVEDGVPLKSPNSKKKQIILLSATLNEGIAELADFTMKEHVYVDSLDEKDNVKADHMVIPNTVTQEFVMTHAKHKLFTLSAILLAKEKNKVFVFMATGQMVDYHHQLFTKYLVRMPKNRGKYDVEVSDDEEEEEILDTEFYKLHGSMDQATRKKVFTDFRKARKGVLICTDVAARGVDVPEADCIIQYTGPQSDEDYLHRVGRTGRAGKTGHSIIFLTHEEQEYIARLQEHKVFLKERQADDYLSHLCLAMEEVDKEKACLALQRRFEGALDKDKGLHKMACFAYSSWSRFYNTYPGKMRSIFNFKDINLGHYVTSFGLKETPSGVARTVKGQVEKVRPRKLNRKLATHAQEEPERTMKRKIKSVSLSVSEYGSGLEPKKKKKKNK